MKLVTYTHQNSAHLGAIDDEYVIDLVQTIKSYRESRGEAGSGSEFPSDMLSFLSMGEEMTNLAQDALKWVEMGEVEPFRTPLSKVIIRSPISNPTKVIGIGLNYADHCREQNIPLPETVLLFAKFPSSIIGPEESITWDADVSQAVDYEAELAVVMGREAFRVDPEHALETIAGYTIANDISARDVQFADRQWVRGKSFDTFCPLGPYLATPDEIKDPDNLAIKTRLNGELVQDSNTNEMVFKIPEIISFISRSITLVPGDVICTGTPDGVGYFRDPKLLLKPGDIVEVEIDGLGILRNPVI